MKNILLIKGKKLSKKKKNYQRFNSFLESTSNFEHFLKKIELIAPLYPILMTPKDVLKCLNFYVLRQAWELNVLTSRTTGEK